LRVAFLTHGCRLNQYESDALAARFQEAGHERVGEESLADLIILNTCTVTQAADREGRRLARRLGAVPGPARVVVTGCSAQRDPTAYASIPGVRLVAGNSHKHRLLDLLGEPGSTPHPVRVESVAGEAPVSRVRSLLSRGRSSHQRAYLRVQDGCDQTCTFCTLPRVRGRSASLPLAAVRHEARLLAGAGHREIVLTGAHLGSYGYDLAPRVSLASLIRAVLEEAPASRVRLSSLEPRFVSAEILGMLRHEPRLCPHLHLPLQSGDDGVLSRMRRAYRAGPFERRALAAADAVAAARPDRPGLALGSDFIVGFPGEDEAAFEATMSLVERLPFTYGHVFPYSDRPGTPAASLDGRVPQALSRRRAARLRALLERKAAEYRGAHMGQVVEIVVEGVDPEPDGSGIASGTSERFLAVRARFERGFPPVRSRVGVRVTGVAGPALRAEAL
jgi:threonylcarbamoyladenosine tRNA methylthiotransferase MtaB